MKTVTVHKAQGIGDREVESLTLVLEQEAPSFQTLVEHAAFYQQEAEQVVDVLCRLPGGTFDQVLYRLLKLRASLFVVPLFDDLEGGDA